MPTRRRLDAELVRRGLARSREQAVDLIVSGRVSVRGRVATKAATAVDPADAVVVSTAGEPAGAGYASRGGTKLSGALDGFAQAGTPVLVEGRRCLDAGASTGGFTDVLLRRGAAEVLAVDVGYGQLAWGLRTDSRVRVLDRTNVRALTLDQVGAPVDLVVADLSFISLGLVLPALASCTAADGDLVLMVKPQFEVGRSRLGRDGVVRRPELRAEAVTKVIGQAAQLALGLRGVTASRLPGPSGNVEYFVWVSPAAAAAGDDEVRAQVDDAVRRGPA